MYLYGAGGHSKVIIDILRSNNVEITALIDDNINKGKVSGCDVVSFHSVKNLSQTIISIGSNETRKIIADKLVCDFGKAIHPSSIISDSATIKEGSVVMQGTIIQAESVIGRHCIINSGASVGHECNISDYVHVAPHSTLCGNVHVGEGAFIGAGSTVIPGIKIGKWATIGAGAAVVEDVPDYAIVVGVPARILKFKK